MNLRNKTIIALLCLSLGWTANAQTNAVQKYVEQLKTTEELKDAVWGVKVAKADGSVLVEHNSNKRMLPASNLKLITTGLALNELGPDYKFTTRLAYSGSVDDGVLKGDLYLIGGGDPTIGMRDSVAFQLQKTFSEWASMLRKAGISHIDGRIIGDGRYFDGEDQNLSWQLEDSYCGDGSAMSALSFYGNLLDTRVAPGKSLGSPVQVEPLFPELPWMNWRNTCVTAAKGEGNDLYFLCTTLAPVASMSGTYALDQPAKRLTCANPFGAMTCAYYFYRYLENEGILAAEGPADIDASGNIRDFEQEAMQPARAQRSLTVIGESRSPALKDIVRETNYRSDNFYAETLLRTLALEKTGSARYDSCAVAESAALAKLGVALAGSMQIMDGSGLGRKNYVSPAFFVQFLTAMRGTAVFKDYLKSLPQPGKYGTLSTRMVSSSPEVKNRIYMKSGSLNGVRCFSGYILPSSGKDEDTIIFSVMTNNTIAETSRINFIMDKIIGLMAAEN